MKKNSDLLAGSFSSNSVTFLHSLWTTQIFSSAIDFHRVLGEILPFDFWDHKNRHFSVCLFENSWRDLRQILQKKYYHCHCFNFLKRDDIYVEFFPCLI